MVFSALETPNYISLSPDINSGGLEKTSPENGRK